MFLNCHVHSASVGVVASSRVLAVIRCQICVILLGVWACGGPVEDSSSLKASGSSSGFLYDDQAVQSDELQDGLQRTFDQSSLESDHLGDQHLLAMSVLAITVNQSLTRVIKYLIAVVGGATVSQIVSEMDYTPLGGFDIPRLLSSYLVSFPSPHDPDQLLEPNTQDSRPHERFYDQSQTTWNKDANNTYEPHLVFDVSSSFGQHSIKSLEEMIKNLDQLEEGVELESRAAIKKLKDSLHDVENNLDHLHRARENHSISQKEFLEQKAELQKTLKAQIQQRDELAVHLKDQLMNIHLVRDLLRNSLKHQRHVAFKNRLERIFRRPWVD